LGALQGRDLPLKRTNGPKAFFDLADLCGHHRHRRTCHHRVANHRFFTIWSNFAGGVVMLWIAAGRPISQRVTFALATALTIVALVYHALLAADHHPVELDWWTNLNFHTIIPAAFILWWTVFSDRAHLTWRSLPWVMVFPILYSAFALIYGANTGFYAYFFLDLPSLGWGQMLINMTGLSAFFVLMGAVLLGLRNIIPNARV
jgi:hypothetical protein